MPSQPYVSIIIPAKNASRWLPMCLEAVVNQDFPKEKYEILVIDNGSTDNTIQIAKNYGAFVARKAELKIGALRNYGADIAKGSIFGFIDADVVVSKHWITSALSCLDINDEVACAGSFPRVPEEFNWVAKSWWHLQIPRTSSHEKEVEWLPSMNIVVNKKAFDRVKGFNTDLITCEDVDFCYRLGEKSKIIYCDNMKAYHYGEPNSLKELFRKERWRGLSNYDGLKYHGFKLSELPSFLLPVYYISLFLSLIASLAFGLKWLILTSVLLLVLPPFLKSYLAFKHLSASTLCFQMAACYFVYCMARTLSQIDWLKSAICHSKYSSR